MTTLVEGFDPDAIALARLLAGEGHTVRLASPLPETVAGAGLRDRGIHVEPHADLDSDPGPAEVAYLDVWTPEVAPRVQRLRAQGTRVSCLADLLLERWNGPTLGITGTAGKTTTTSLVASILRAGGIDVAVSAGARAGNLWPTADLLDRLQEEDGTARTRLLLELTSSHLAFMRHSPNIAAVVAFWPDHLELHGDLPRYLAAKETIVRHQQDCDTVVVNADDRSVDFAAATPAALVEFSLRRPVERGAYLDPARRVSRSCGPCRRLGSGRVLAALSASARAAGPVRVARGRSRAERPRAVKREPASAMLRGWNRSLTDSTARRRSPTAGPSPSAYDARWTRRSQPTRRSAATTSTSSSTRCASTPEHDSNATGSGQACKLRWNRASPPIRMVPYPSGATPAYARVHAVKVTMLLADFAQVADGKLTVVGGGWSLTGPAPTPFGIAILVHVPWDQANRRHTLRLELVDADGRAVTVPREEDGEEAPIVFLNDIEFEVGRPAGIKPGTPLELPLAVNSGPLPLEPGSRYEWRLSIDGEGDEDWRLAFSVRLEEDPA